MSAHPLETSVRWTSYRNYTEAKARARKECKPILLDLFAISCSSCLKLEELVYPDPDVVHAINEFTIPVRVETDYSEINIERARIIDRHLFICSPTIQLLSCEGVTFHEFADAPRHTRLDLGYRGVHYDLPGRLTPAGFLSQLALGLAKFYLDRSCPLARDILDSLAEPEQGDPLAREESSSLLQALRDGAADRVVPMTNSAMTPLARAVARYCDVLMRVPDSEISLPWRGPRDETGPERQTDTLRDMVFAIYKRLSALSIAIDKARARETTNVQRMLRQHQRSFRELQGLLLGVPQGLIDLQPIPEKRTIRGHLVHATLAEYWAQLPSAQVFPTGEALPEKLLQLRALEIQETLGPLPAYFGSLPELLERHERVHASLVHRFSTLSDTSLEAPGAGWEFQPVPVAFRLARLGWHLRDHCTSVETLLQGGCHRRSEAASLARSLYSALGSAEGAMIGAEKNFERLVQPVIAFIRTRMAELQAHYLV
jgi:hypothetical protein